MDDNNFDAWKGRKRLNYANLLYVPQMHRNWEQNFTHIMVNIFFWVSVSPAKLSYMVNRCWWNVKIQEFSSIFQFLELWAEFHRNFLICKMTYDINRFRILMLRSGLKNFSQDILVFIYGHNFFLSACYHFHYIRPQKNLCIWGTCVFGVHAPV